MSGSIRAACPDCGARLAAAPTAAGKTIRCPKCGAAVPVPAAAPAGHGQPDTWQPVDEPARHRSRQPRQPGGRVTQFAVAGLIAMIVLGCVAIGAVALWSMAGGRVPRQQGPLPEEVNLKGVQIDRPSTPFVVRGDCQMTTYFNYDFRNAEKTHYSVKLEQADPYARMHCYIRRDSADGQQLAKLLGRGESRVLTLECRLSGRSAEIAELIRVVKWE